MSVDPKHIHQIVCIAAGPYCGVAGVTRGSQHEPWAEEVRFPALLRQIEKQAPAEWGGSAVIIQMDEGGIVEACALESALRAAGRPVEVRQALGSPKISRVELRMLSGLSGDYSDRALLAAATVRHADIDAAARRIVRLSR